jgi:hypothetical protein
LINVRKRLAALYPGHQLHVLDEELQYTITLTLTLSKSKIPHPNFESQGVGGRADHIR